MLIGGQHLVSLLVFAGLLGGLMFTVYPVSVAHVNDHLDADTIVPASAALILPYGIGAALGPVGAAGLTIVASAHGLFLFIVLVGALLGAAAWLVPTRWLVARDDRTPFVAMSRTSHVMAQLDPRAEEEHESTVPVEETEATPDEPPTVPWQPKPKYG